ncbi:hypothetical protein ABZV34_23965 [Streptomyces sp. NPDC005195]|uniref:hypothetical protein n=1 Tax=Streptomyces sp. NPDC005195 TaxID=3154561 RepID=UPI0033A2CCB6
MSSELSGVDLARQALAAAREAAKKNGGRRQEKKPKRSRRQVAQRDGSEPLGLGTAITMMMTERGMVAPAAGSSLLAQFGDLLAAAAPELAGHVQAVTFDADTGRLDVASRSPRVRHEAALERTQADHSDGAVPTGKWLSPMPCATAWPSMHHQLARRQQQRGEPRNADTCGAGH